MLISPMLVYVTILNSEIDKRSLSISHFVRRNPLRPLAPNLKKVGQNCKFQNGPHNELTGKIFLKEEFLLRKSQQTRNGFWIFALVQR